jgi:hypothetical protein
MIELNLARPPVDQRPSVKVLYTTDTQELQKVRCDQTTSL